MSPAWCTMASMGDARREGTAESSAGPAVGARRWWLPLSVASAGLLAATLVTLTLAIGWATWRVVDALRPPEPPLWTEADLPGPPPPDNGWLLLRDEIPEHIFTPPELELLDELRDRESPLAERVALWRAHHERLLWIQGAYAEQLGAADRILGLPHLADECEIAMDREECPGLQVLTLTRWWAFEQLAFAHRGALRLALRRARRGLEALLELRDSAHNPVTHLIAHMAVEEMLADIELLIATAPEGAAVPDAEALRHRLAHLPAFDPGPAYRAQYVAERRALDDMLETSRGRATQLSIHPRACTAAHNAFNRQLASHIRDPSSPPPETPEIGEATPWYINNRFCDLLLDTLLHNQPLRVQHGREVDARLRATAQSVVAALDERRGDGAEAGARGAVSSP